MTSLSKHESQILQKLLGKITHAIVEARIDGRVESIAAAACAEAARLAGTSFSVAKTSNSNDGLSGEESTLRNALQVACEAGPGGASHPRRLIDKWFSLSTLALPSLSADLREHQDQLTLPLYIHTYLLSPDIPLAEPTLDRVARSYSRATRENGFVRIPLESWAYRWTPSGNAGKGPIQPAYKEAVILIRSLVALLRVLPTHSLVRRLRRHRTSPSCVTFAIVGAARAARELEDLGADARTPLGTVDTPSGRITLSVAVSAAADVLPIAPAAAGGVLIADYEGSRSPSTGGVARSAPRPISRGPTHSPAKKDRAHATPPGEAYPYASPSSMPTPSMLASFNQSPPGAFVTSSSVRSVGSRRGSTRLPASPYPGSGDAPPHSALYSHSQSSASPASSYGSATSSFLLTHHSPASASPRFTLRPRRSTVSGTTTPSSSPSFSSSSSSYASSAHRSRGNTVHGTAGEGASGGHSGRGGGDRESATSVTAAVAAASIVASVRREQAGGGGGGGGGGSVFHGDVESSEDFAVPFVADEDWVSDDDEFDGGSGGSGSAMGSLAALQALSDTRSAIFGDHHEGDVHESATSSGWGGGALGGSERARDRADSTSGLNSFMRACASVQELPELGRPEEAGAVLDAATAAITEFQDWEATHKW